MSGKVIARTDVDRETLEQMALESCPAEQYYDLLDNLEQATDEELELIIDKVQSLGLCDPQEYDAWHTPSN